MELDAYSGQIAVRRGGAILGYIYPVVGPDGASRYEARDTVLGWWSYAHASRWAAAQAIEARVAAYNPTEPYALPTALALPPRADGRVLPRQAGRGWAGLGRWVARLFGGDSRSNRSAPHGRLH